MVGGSGHDDQAFFLRVDRDLGLGDQVGEDGGEARRRVSFKRVELKLGGVRIRSLGLELLERGLDHLVIGRDGPGDERVAGCPGRELGLGDQRGEQRQRGRGLGLGERIDLDGGLAFRGCLALEAGQRRFEQLVVLGQGVGDQLGVASVEREPCVGNEGLHLGYERRAAGRQIGAPHRVGLESRLHFRRASRLDLLQRRLDRFVLRGAGPGQQPAAFRVQHELRFGEQLLEHCQHARRIGRRDGVSHQLELLFGGQVALELFEDLLDDLVLRRLGPHGQLPRLGVGDHLHAGQLRGQRTHHGLETRPLGGRDRIDGQLVSSLDEHFLGDLVDRLLDLGVLGGRTDDHQQLAAVAHCHLRLRRHLLDHFQQAGGHGKRQFVELQLGSVGPRLLRLEGLERVFDHRLIRRNRQRDERPGLGIDREPGVGQDRFQER